MSFRLNPRDMHVSTIVAEHYGMPIDELAKILQTSTINAYRIAKRWREAGLMAKLPVKPVPGYYWIYCTPKSAEELLGHPVRYWAPTPKMAKHTLTVLRVRLALVGAELGNWISERTLRYEVSAPNIRGHRRPHVHDGRYTTDKGELWAVEVELSPKDPAYARDSVQRAYQAAQAAHCAGLIYYCADQQIKDLITSCAGGLQLSTTTRFRVALLEDVLPDEDDITAAATRTRQGLWLIDGGKQTGSLR
ncbi:hypothetical protein [Nocardia sp. CC227C]|uniref:hypothetical protein n=1 Tax=Nocardia sp. CC227C TaxID=3044562 RepID=UPI00278C526D|nr:hypothetical protein [Nocardia sp. CC227C]